MIATMYSDQPEICSLHGCEMDGEFCMECAKTTCPECHGEAEYLSSHSFTQANGCDADVDVWQCRHCDHQWSD